MGMAQIICWVMVLVSGLMVATGIIGMDSFKTYGAGPALMVVGLVVGLTSFICVFLFRSRDRCRRRLREGKDLLARWSLPEDEWRAFAHKEYETQRSEKKLLLLILGVIAIIAIIVCAVIDPTFGVWMLCILGGTWILCLGASWLALRPYKINENSPAPEARVREDGLLLDATFHIWKGWGNRLEDVAISEGPPMQLDITYSVPTGRGSRTTMTAGVPVPAGKEQEAVELARRLLPNK
jgi:hypothetical protein